MIPPLTVSQRRALEMLRDRGPLTLHQWRDAIRGTTDRSGNPGRPTSFEPGALVTLQLVRASGERGDLTTTYSLSPRGERALDLYAEEAR
ncbi:MAG: hypothetical protein EBZ50_03840 [Alphaproteobacteria bacterium]|nr:hypothetical protein [Alphaproteobacteria bacterium]